MSRALLVAAAAALCGCFTEASLLAQCVDAGKCPFVMGVDGGTAQDGGPEQDGGSDAGTTLPPGLVQSPFDVVVDVALVPVPIGGQAECYRSAVLTRRGELVGIPCNRSVDGGARVLVMGADGGFRTVGLVTNVTHQSWYAGVLGADGLVYGIPHGDEYFLRIDPESGANSRVGPPIAGSERYRGGVTLRDGRIFAVPYGVSSAAVFDPRDGGVEFIASGQSRGLRGVGGTLLRDGTVVFSTDDSSTTSSIWTFDGVTLRAASTTSAVGRSVTLADGGALFLPTNSTRSSSSRGLAAARPPSRRSEASAVRSASSRAPSGPAGRRSSRWVAAGCSSSARRWAPRLATAGPGPSLSSSTSRRCPTAGWSRSRTTRTRTRSSSRRRCGSRSPLR